MNASPPKPSVVRPYQDGPAFVITSHFWDVVAEYEPDPMLQADYVNGVVWEAARDPQATDYDPGDRSWAFDSFGLPGWPILRIYLWFESADRIHVCDALEP